MTDTPRATRASVPAEAFILLSIGCAECRYLLDEALVEEVLRFDALEAAKAHVEAIYPRASWTPHPAGGVFYAHSSGEMWIAPASAFGPAAPSMPAESP